MLTPDLSGRQILVAPLNWGLGHATRCMPVIDLLCRWGATVVLGSDGRSGHLLRQEYPQLDYVELPSYNVRYTSGSTMPLVTLWRSPVYLNAVYREHRMLQELVRDRALDLVISDNRYGLWSRKVPSIFMSHQVAIIPPAGAGWTTGGFYWLQRAFYGGFREVWVPDFAGSPNLTGRLSHRYIHDARLRFVGPLSRFMGMKPSPNPAYRADYVVVLSGPEPQRSLLESVLAEQAERSPGTWLVVQGKTEARTESRNGNLHVVSFLTARELFDALYHARVVVARAGYSTIMDLACLGARSILIPTPGQTEQEYLAARLQRQGMAVIQEQDQLDLTGALEQAAALPGFEMMQDAGLLEEVMAAAIRRHLPAPTPG